MVIDAHRPAGVLPGLEAQVGAVIGFAALILAVAGGLIFTGLALMTTLSIVGRALVSLGLGPIPGDFELLEAGTAIAVFAFLPWCQLRGGHVTVDLLVERFPAKLAEAFTLLGNLAMTAVAALLAWRLYAGMGDRFRYNETTMILGIDLGIPYAASLVGAIFFVIASAYTVWRSVNRVAAAPWTRAVEGRP